MILCVDIGGTSAKMALMELSGEIAARHSTATAFDNYETPLLDTVNRGIDEFLRETGAAVEGIAVSATGQIDVKSGVVIGTGGNIRNYEGAEIKRTLEREYGVPVHVLNDANAAALGESYMGCACGRNCVIMITLGTGVGGGIVINGSVFGGSKGFAGEIGHTALYADKERCACGKRGCLETYASVKALLRRAESRIGERLNGRELFERAANGDAAVLELLDEWMDDIAEGASSLVHIFNPDMLVIGGGVSAQRELLVDPLRKKILDRTMPEFADGLEIVPAALDNDAGLYGALKFWLDAEG